MEKTILLLLAVMAFTIVAAALVCHAQTNAAPVAQLTPQDVTSINNLLPLLPASWQGGIIKALAIIGTLGVLGRVIIG